MRDSLTTRKIFSKVPRDGTLDDAFIYIDRLRQAVSDLDDENARLERRIHALEIEKVNFVTDTGVRTKITDTLNTRAANFGSKLFWQILGGVIILFCSFISWLAGNAHIGTGK